jgi:hypothetical protein
MSTLWEATQNNPRRRQDQRNAHGGAICHDHNRWLLWLNDQERRRQRPFVTDEHWKEVLLLRKIFPSR